MTLKTIVSTGARKFWEFMRPPNEAEVTAAFGKNFGKLKKRKPLQLQAALERTRAEQARKALAEMPLRERLASLPGRFLNAIHPPSDSEITAAFNRSERKR